MKAAIKRRINEVVQQAVTSAGHLGLKRQRQGYWTARRDEVQWEVETLYEEAYGEGVFRVGWGVLAPGLAEIVDRVESEGIYDATVGGDVGSLATRSRRMVMLCVPGATMGHLNRWLWKAKPEPEEVLAARIAGWLSGPVTSVFQSMTTRREIVDFLENHEARYGKVFMHPEDREQELALIAGLRALDGDIEGALTAIDAWRSMLRPGSDSYGVLSAKVDRIAGRIRRLPRGNTSR
jgi:hypothetical protein